MNNTQPVSIVLRPGSRDDEPLVADLLAGLSPTTSFQRFLTGLGGPTRILARDLLAARGDRGAVLAVGSAADGARVVGHACWVVTAGVADIGVVVTDAAQDRGIGTALFLAAADAGRAAGASVVHLDLHPDNRRLVAALRRRLGRGALAWEHGLVTVDAPLSLVVPALDAALPSAA